MFVVVEFIANGSFHNFHLNFFKGVVAFFATATRDFCNMLQFSLFLHVHTHKYTQSLCRLPSTASFHDKRRIYAHTEDYLQKYFF